MVGERRQNKDEQKSPPGLELHGRCFTLLSQATLLTEVTHGPCFHTSVALAAVIEEGYPSHEARYGAHATRKRFGLSPSGFRPRVSGLASTVLNHAASVS